MFRLRIIDCNNFINPIINNGYFQTHQHQFAGRWSQLQPTDQTIAEDRRGRLQKLNSECS